MRIRSHRLTIRETGQPFGALLEQYEGDPATGAACRTWSAKLADAGAVEHRGGGGKVDSQTNHASSSSRRFLAGSGAPAPSVVGSLT
jgi:hypothetical protein